MSLSKNDSVYLLARLAVEQMYGRDYAKGGRGLLLDIALGSFSPDDGLENVRTKCERVLRLLDPEADEQELRDEYDAMEIRIVDT